MCGIVGMISKTTSGFSYSDLDMFQDMMVCDSVRGDDSTGVFGVYRNKQARTVKVAAEPHLLFRCEEWKDFRTKAINSMTMLVGHNRSATRGAVNSDNAHPFAEGKIVLVHNGTLHNHKDFNKEVEVDSHAIAHALNEKPVEEVIKGVDGAFTFVWYDREKQKLFMIRNSERPLAYIDTGSQILFASEAPMLEWLVNRKGYVTHTAKIVPTNTLFEIDSRGQVEGKTMEMYTPPKRTWVGNTSYYPTMTTPPTKHSGTAGGVNYDPEKIPCNTKVLIKVTACEDIPGTPRYKVKGYVDMPDHPKTDVVGWFDRSLDQADIDELVSIGQAEAVISSSVRSNCGDSYWVRDVNFALILQTHNDLRVPALHFNYLIENHKCAKCDGEVKRSEADYTSVKRKNNSSRYRLVCAKCVGDALDEATKPSTKFQDSDTNVSEGESVSERLTVAYTGSRRTESLAC